MDSIQKSFPGGFLKRFTTSFHQLLPSSLATWVASCRKVSSLHREAPGVIILFPYVPIPSAGFEVG